MLHKLKKSIESILFSNLKTIENFYVRIFFKLTWIIAVSLSLCGLVFYSYEAFLKWHSTPVILISIKSIQSIDIPFPAITTCRPDLPEQFYLNMDRNAFFNRFHNNSFQKNFTSEEQNKMALTVQTCYPQFSEIIKKKYFINRTEKDIAEFLRNATFNSGFTSCEINKRRQKCLKILFRTLTDFGLCYTFNMQNYEYIFREGKISESSFIYNSYLNKSSKNNFSNIWSLNKGYDSDLNLFAPPLRAKKEHGFDVRTDIACIKTEYCEATGRTFKYIIHLPNEIPTLFHDTHYVEINKMAYFEVKVKINKINPNIFNYPPEIRQCYIEGEKRLKFFKTYTKNLCDFECLTNYTLEVCGCVKFTMPRINDTKVCDINKVQCYDKIIRTWPNVYDEQLLESKCNCLSPCTDISYSFRERKRNAFYHTTEVSKYYTHFHAGIKEHTAKEYTSYVAYTLQNFIADCGGLIGLFLGFSLLSIYEIFYDFIAFALKSLLSSAKRLLENSFLKIISKLLWIVAVLFSISGFLFYVINIYIKWKIDPDILISIRKISSNEIPFPAITICYPFFPNQLQNLPANPHTIFINKSSKIWSTRYTQLEKNYLAVAAQTCYLEESQAMKKEFFVSSKNSNIVDLLLKSDYSFGYGDCEFHLITIKCKNILSRFLTDYGICETYNSQGFKNIFSEAASNKDFEKFKEREITKYPYYYSPNHKIKVNDSEDANWTLSDGYKIKDEEVLPVRALSKNVVGFYIDKIESLYQCYPNDRGYTIYFHLPNEILTPFHKNRFVELTHEKRFVINAIKISNENMKNYKPETRLCYYEGEKVLKFFKTYTKNLCDFECMTNFTLEVCDCVKFNMPRSNETEVCGVDKIKCYHNIKKSWPNIHNIDVSEACKCLEPCTNIKYSITVKREAFRANIQTYFTVSFASQTIEEHSYYVSYTLQNFIADSGGLIGLFLGFSLLSIFEFIYSFFITFKKRWKFQMKISDVKIDQSTLGESFSGYFQRILKVFTILISICSLIFYINQAFEKWHISPDISISTSKIQSKEIPFPAITICSTIFPSEAIHFINPVYLINYLNLRNKTLNLSETHQNYLAVAIQTCIQNIFHSQKLIKNRTETDIIKLLLNSTSKVFFSRCQLGDKIENCEKFLQTSLTDIGVCYTTNMQNYKRILNNGFDILQSSNHNLSNETQWTLGDGYSTQNDDIFPFRSIKQNVINLEISIKEFFERKFQFCMNEGFGFKLFFHMPNEIPTTFHKTHFIKNYYTKVIKLNAKIYNIDKSLQTYPPNARNCYLEGEKRLKFFKTYTKKLCDFECLTNYTLKVCGCIKFTMPKSNDTKVCDIDKFKCYYEITMSWPNFKIKNYETDVSKNCECLESCTNIEYYIDVEQESLYGDQIDGRSHLKIKFEKETIKMNTKYVAYTIQNFLADCGGLIGIFLGFSLLSIFELICNFVVYCLNKIQTKIKPNIAWK
ncbi:hypothetical protein PVAND_003017 [Polypedilum vanderplanki]|uniref:Uncharacterized protein n=1 Tax=Polypedilum vanderplanki TaxID=319348 RepID=A0A9J6BSR8_POLVA|nr:hypothetical protein PVAND_003017 [Polypedilum vanderplanki]